MKKFLVIIVLGFLWSGSAYSKDSFKSKLLGKEINYLAKCKTEDNQIQMFGFNGYTTLEMATNAPKSLKKIARISSSILKRPGNTIGTFHVSRKGKNYPGAAFAVFLEDDKSWYWTSGGVSKKNGPFIRKYTLYNNKILSKKNAKLKTTVMFFNDKKIKDIALELFNVGKKSVTENITETPDDYFLSLINASKLEMDNVIIPASKEQYKEFKNKGGFIDTFELQCTKM